MCLNGSFKMTAFRNRLLGLAAGTLALSSFSSMAYAQTTQEVFDFSASTFQKKGPGAIVSTFTFNQSLILNSIGFVFDDSIYGSLGATSFGYEIVLPGESSGVNFQYTTQVTEPSNGITYFDIPNPTTYAIGTRVFVVSQGRGETFGRLGFTPYAVGVTHSNLAGSTFASGNLRVTPLGGSVAPEPGSFALALTGGAALLGICIRRRRNAA